MGSSSAGPVCAFSQRTRRVFRVSSPPPVGSTLSRAIQSSVLCRIGSIVLRPSPSLPSLAPPRSTESFSQISPLRCPTSPPSSSSAYSSSSLSSCSSSSFVLLPFCRGGSILLISTSAHFSGSLKGIASLVSASDNCGTSLSMSWYWARKKRRTSAMPPSIGRLLREIT